MNILLIFPGFILAFIIVFCYERKMKNMYAKIDAAYKNKNRVHFYVARDKNGTLFLYLGKPIRKENEFSAHHVVYGSCYFKKCGLNVDDYKDLRWEDEPVEVFLNLKD